MLIGNDIVDCTTSLAREKVGDQRFIRRVFLPSEQDFIARANDRLLTLWAMWAAKEAAYKLEVKSSGRYELMFRYKRYEVFCSRLIGHGMSLGVVKFGDCHAPLALIARPPYVHAVAFQHTHSGSSSSKVFYSARELGDGDHDHSLEVRRLAVQLLDELGYHGCSIVRNRMNGLNLPPQVEGVDCGEALDLSLSHDGRYVAVSIAVDTP